MHRQSKHPCCIMPVPVLPTVKWMDQWTSGKHRPIHLKLSLEHGSYLKIPVPGVQTLTVIP